ncbi:hypothetical protein F5X99DRAFT_413036 [Biscogniauxia marginata]|nr:hypothetical protein F5X99DRAFT_413036 [Biscogniauxia marginata]
MSDFSDKKLEYNPWLVKDPWYPQHAGSVSHPIGPSNYGGNSSMGAIGGSLENDGDNHPDEVDAGDDDDEWMSNDPFEEEVDGSWEAWANPNEDGTAPDDPDVLDGDSSKDQVTLGVELEFLLAVHPNIFPERVYPLRDPHPDDTRWCSRKLTTNNWSHHIPNTDFTSRAADRFARTCRSKIARTLRAANLTVVKYPDYRVVDAEYHSKTVEPNDFSESEATDDELELNYANASILSGWNPPVAQWNHNMDENENVVAAHDMFLIDFVNFHAVNGLRMYRTRKTDVDNMLPKLSFNGPWAGLSNGRVRVIFAESVWKRIWNAKQRNENRRNEQVDPLHVSVAGMEPQYRAWTVTADSSVNGRGMTPDRYNIPPHRSLEIPIEEYKWFGAEVVSPVLPAGREATYDAIRAACGGLRNALRVHKPMRVSTGLHVHMGHQCGWNLLQLKRLATLWFLTERLLLSLHRVDRGIDRLWCAKIGEGSRLWAGLYSPEPEVVSRCSDAIPSTAGPAADINKAALDAHVPFALLDSSQQGFLAHLWQITTINELASALNGYHNTRNMFLIRVGLRWRVSGDKRTEDAGSEGGDPVQQTVEARVMQGTLDADNINHWIVVLECIVRTVRNWSTADFRQLLQNHLSNQPAPQRGVLLQLLGVPLATRNYWANPIRRDATDSWFEYPDKDRVDWEQPFMVPGHRATHGAQWDD